VDIVALAALAALTLIFFWQIALTNRILTGLDVFAYFYPYRDFASEAMRAGRLPLWNPYLFMGAPLLANSQVAALYPLHWPLLWLSTPKQIAWSIVLHIWLAGAGAYLFARRSIKLRPLAAFVAAAVFGLGGFLGAQVEHVNQLNASAWLPWLLLCIDGAMARGRWRWLEILGGGAVAALALLAGHTQAAYVVFFGAGLYALLRGWPEFRARKLWHGLRGVGALALMTAIGLMLAAGQLLPTLELSSLSVRSGGLPYNEAASFSLKPGLIFKAFLPPLLWEPPFSEYVAYVGLIGLTLLAVGTWAILRRKRAGGALLGLALIGVFLAFGAYNPVYWLLYKLVPGFDLFRAPARWLLLYTFGAAVVAGIGLEMLALPTWVRALGEERRWPALGDSAWKPALAILLVLELLVAGRQLAYGRPTAPAAFDSMRTAPSHLLADAVYESPGKPFRFLSMSDIGYDPGDLEDLQSLYAGVLSEEAIYDLIVATKMKEVLAYNLPLRYRLFSVDGYDGGLLPTQSYVNLERLFLSEEEIWPDGRLRQQLRQIPPARLLSLLNIKYVITDKTQDAWIDDVFYDLEHTVPLGELTLSDLPSFESTHLGVASYLNGAASLPDGTPVAEIVMHSSDGTTVTRTLRAGEHTAEGLYDPATTQHTQARVGHHWRDDARGSDYVAVLDLGQVMLPDRIAIRALLPGEQVRLRGLSLIDNETGTSRNLSIDPAYSLVHSGDVKIYENLTVLPRTFIVDRAQMVVSDGEALSLLQSPSFDPASEVVLVSAEMEGLVPGTGRSEAKIVSYLPERVEIETSLESAGYLVLTDSYYPGWEAKVDGTPVSIERADLYFRAVHLEPGEHQVVFSYTPSSLRTGLGIGVAAWFLWGLACIVTVAVIGRKSASSV
jgi:hypothetical protein